MNRDSDSNLVELARKWGLRFIGYKKVLSELSLGKEPWWADLTFYHYLLASGCEPIGRTGDAVYMRCGSRVAYFSTDTIGYYYYGRDVKLLEGEIKKILKLKLLTRELLKYNKLTSVSVDFRNFIKFGIYGSESVELLNLGNINLYLAKVEVNFSYGVNPNIPHFGIGINALIANITWYFMNIWYIVKEDGTVERESISITPYADETLKARGIREEELLRVLNEKHLVIDGLLRSAEEVVISGIKALTMVFLY